MTWHRTVGFDEGDDDEDDIATILQLDSPGGSWVECTQVYEQGYRVADESKDVYELYVGNGAPPDFDGVGQPVATSPTLPFSYTPTLPSSGNATFYVVVRRRNKYSLESFNVYTTTLVYAAGVAALPPISAPRNVRVYDGVSPTARVVAKYVNSEDPVPADTWQVFAKVGSDPVPGVDLPIFTSAMSFLGVETGISQPLSHSGWAAGNVLHVIVAAYRSSDGARASAPVVLHTLAVPIDLTSGFLFGGSAYEQD